MPQLSGHGEQPTVTGKTARDRCPNPLPAIIPNKSTIILMKYLLKSGDLLRLKTDCLAIGVFQDQSLSRSAAALDRASGGYIAGMLKSGCFAGKSGTTFMLYRVPGCPAERVLLIGLGSPADFKSRSYQRACQTAAAGVRRIGAVHATLCLPELAPKGTDLGQAVRQAATAAVEANYQYSMYKPSAAARSSLRQVDVYTPDDKHANDLSTGLAIGESMNLCRELGDLPGNVCTPIYLAGQAQKLTKEHKGLKLTVLDERRMKSLGMGSFLSVAQGSEQPPRLIILEYKGGGGSQKPVVLVGKGITFDTGGISLKPGPGMDEMKFDMCGAASVMALMKLCASLKLPINVIGMMAAAENMPDGRATRPGDVVTTLSGQTVEILNTDAEGRLVLCDTLTYAERYEPELVIDIATLTGACIMALGNQASGLMTNDEALCQELQTASDVSGDRIWRLPLWEEYGESLKSNFADMANVGGKGAGTSIAGVFLSRFTRKFRWAHLDIAGTAWHSGDRKGASGRPVPLLAQFLINRAGASAADAGKRRRRGHNTRP